MHAIIAFNAPNFVGAGRQPLAAIHNLPDNYPKPIRIDCVDDALGCLRVQDIDAPVATSPVPALAQEDIVLSLQMMASLKRVRTVNKLEGLGMIERRNTRIAEKESGPLAQASSLKRVRTINRLDGLSKLERRKAHLAGDDFTIARPLTGAVYASKLKRVRTINKSSGLAMLGRRSAGDSDAVLAESEVSTLKRVRTINKRAGLKILECRKAIQALFAAAQTSPSGAGLQD